MKRIDATQRAAPPRVAYLVQRFPVLSQTFVTNEVGDHLRNGLDVCVFALGSPEDADFPAADLPDVFAGRVAYLSIPQTPPARLLYLVRALASSPGLLGAAVAAAFFLPTATLGARLLAACLAVALSRALDGVDVLHCHFGQTGRLAAAALSGVRHAPRLAVTFHGYEMTHRECQPLGAYYRGLLDSKALLLPVSDLWRERLLAAGAVPERVKVQHMGVDTGALREAATTLGRSGRLRMVMVARMVEKKGHAIALQALAEAARRRPDLELRLDLVGDGPLRSDLAALTRTLGLEEAVGFLGPCGHDQTLRRMADTDAVMLASLTAADGDMEGIPVVLMEAMALAKPVISTRHSGIPELVLDGACGLLADEGDHRGLASAIETLADQPALRQQFGQAGRARVAEAFDMAALGVALRGLYIELLGSPGAE